MKKVTRDKFLGTLGAFDVHPRTDAPTLRDRWHISYWELQKTRKILGTTKSDSWGVEPTKFYLHNNT